MEPSQRLCNQMEETRQAGHGMDNSWIIFLEDPRVTT